MTSLIGSNRLWALGIEANDLEFLSSITWNYSIPSIRSIHYWQDLQKRVNRGIKNVPRRKLSNLLWLYRYISQFHIVLSIVRLIRKLSNKVWLYGYISQFHILLSVVKLTAKALGRGSGKGRRQGPDKCKPLACLVFPSCLSKAPRINRKIKSYTLSVSVSQCLSRR